MRRDLSKPLAESFFGEDKKAARKAKRKARKAGKKAAKAGKKAAKAIGKALKSGKNPKKEGKAQPLAQSKKAKVNPKGAALGAMGGAASTTRPFKSTASQITRRPRQNPKAIGVAPMPSMPTPMKRKATKAKRR